MDIPLYEKLRRMRIEKGFSQQKLSNALHVERSTVAKWESGDRRPSAEIISRISDILGADVAELMPAGAQSEEKPQVILIDDEKIILDGEASILEELLPNAAVRGFSAPAEAVGFAQRHKVQLAFLDIRMGRISGFDICRELLETEPRMNVVYLTAFPEYALDAWGTGACGFLVKPLNAEAVKQQLSHLRWPLGEVI